MKLPKLDVPTFNGDILNWKSFWEQFCVSVHDRTTLSSSKKLVYLQHALKDGSAKRTIEGLYCSGEYYAKAVDCLKSWYDRSRLIHQTHVRLILEASALKEGTGKELCRLHDTVQQHLQALKAMDYEPPGTSMLELKLDANTMFEWQKYSQSSAEVPHYKELLEFIISVLKHLRHLLLTMARSQQRVRFILRRNHLHQVNLLRHLLRTLQIQQVIAFCAKPTSIHCTFVRNSKINRMTKWLHR